MNVDIELDGVVWWYRVAGYRIVVLVSTRCCLYIFYREDHGGPLDTWDTHKRTVIQLDHSEPC